MNLNGFKFFKWNADCVAQRGSDPGLGLCGPGHPGRWVTINGASGLSNMAPRVVKELLSRWWQFPLKAELQTTQQFSSACLINLINKKRIASIGVRSAYTFRGCVERVLGGRSQCHLSWPGEFPTNVLMCTCLQTTPPQPAAFAIIKLIFLNYFY